MKDLKGSKTERNLLAALAGESQARVKYEFYAKKAREEGYQQVADFFEETSTNENQHAKIWFKLLHDGVPTTTDNLLDCVAGENYEWVTMYADFAKEAKEEGFEQIARLFEGVGKIEKDHEDRYQQLFDNIKGDEVFNKPEEKTWICAKCGFKHTGKMAPKKCPICEHPQAYFSIINNDY